MGDSLFGKKTDKSDKYADFRPKEDYYPKSPNQQKYVDALHSYLNNVVVCYGPAGTGKTMFACNAAVNELEKGNVKKIVLTRPVVSVDEELGFLPGNIASKMDPWTRPIMDIFMEFYSKSEVESMISDGTIEISPLAFMRGRTFKKAFIIADEMQNSSPNQMLMLITRIGGNSKMVINGDLRQSDRCENNGLLDLVKRLDVYKPKGIECVGLGAEDVFRSQVVANIIKLYEMDLGGLKGHYCAPHISPNQVSGSPYFVDIETPSNIIHSPMHSPKIHYGVNDSASETQNISDAEAVVEMEIEISELEVAAIDEDEFVRRYMTTPSPESSFGVQIESICEEVDDVHAIQRELENLNEDIVVVYKERQSDSALIPKSHITKNIIRFFNGSSSPK